MLKSPARRKTPHSRPATLKSPHRRSLRSTSTTSTRQPPQTSPQTPQLQSSDPPKPTFAQLKKKRWAVTLGASGNNGLGRASELVYEAHPQRVKLPSLAGSLYLPWHPEFDMVPNAPEEAYADVAQIASGWTSTLAGTTEGRVFQWGWRQPIRSMIKRDTSNDKLGRSFNSFFENTIGYHPWSGGSELPRRLPCFGAETTEQLHDEAQLANVVIPPWMTANRMRAVKLSTNADNCGALTKGGHLFVWSHVGDSHGSLGLGRVYQQAVPPTLLSIPDVIDFAFGYNHLTFVTAQGTLYSTGNSENGATGLPLAFLNLNPKKKRTFRPLSVHTNYEYFYNDLALAYKNHQVATKDDRNGLAKVVKESSGGKEITADQHDYDTKTNRYEKIDLTQFQNKTIKPSEMKRGSKFNPGFSPVNAMGTHEAMRVPPAVLISNVTDNVNFQGVEGREGAIDPINDFAAGKLPEKLPKFKKVACGFAHSLVLDEHGSVWSMGRNSHGELGHTLNPTSDHGKGDTKQHKVVNAGLTPVDFRQHYYPRKISFLEASNIKATKISAGLHHSAVLTHDGEVWTWGSNEYGQCGRLTELPSTLRSTNIGHKQPWSLPPGKLHISPNALNGAKIVDVECGFYDTAITLSDGRCLFTGAFLTKEGTPHAPFSLREFEKLEYEIEGQSSESEDPIEVQQTYIQSIPARDMIPRSLYSEVHPVELNKYTHGLREVKSDINDQSYFMKKPSFGWHHIAALVVPRTYTDTPESAYPQLYPGDLKHVQLQLAAGSGKIETRDEPITPGEFSNEVDQSLLGSDAAFDHFRAMEEEQEEQVEQLFDSQVDNQRPFAKLANRRQEELKEQQRLDREGKG